ncbi:hypothetical protein [Mycolicibacterium hippocampi]|nr:hypothetical protein [Mycolicibacterium hippocampi]
MPIATAKTTTAITEVATRRPNTESTRATAARTTAHGALTATRSAMLLVR